MGIYQTLNTTLLAALPGQNALVTSFTEHLEELQRQGLVWLFFGIFTLVLIMGFVVWIGRKNNSPYTGTPLRHGDNLSYSAVGAHYRFMKRMAHPDNPPVEMRRAAVCMKTGRVFPNALDYFGSLRVNWDFLVKRHPGNWVSWGSLTAEQKTAVERVHISLEGFQTERSSTKAKPEEIEPEFSHLKPGPLYVDLKTFKVMGWKQVPKSELEALIVQNPSFPIH
jgi:hypothetical protein